MQRIEQIHHGGAHAKNLLDLRYLGIVANPRTNHDYQRSVLRTASDLVELALWGGRIVRQCCLDQHTTELALGRTADQFKSPGLHAAMIGSAHGGIERYGELPVIR